jgi:RNA recognition motif-containing protein
MIDFVLSTNSSGYSRGFGWATYSSFSDALSALKSLNGFRIQGNILSVCFARRRGAAYDPRIIEKEMSLFVKGVPLGTTPSHLKMMYTFNKTSIFDIYIYIYSVFDSICLFYV